MLSIQSGSVGPGSVSAIGTWRPKHQVMGNFNSQRPLESTQVQMPGTSLPNSVSCLAPADFCSKGESSLVSRILKSVFSFPAMLGMLLVSAVFVVTGRTFIVDPDFWWHIKVGEDILSSRHWPTVDPYSFTVANHVWIAYEWFAEVVWALAHRLGGLEGMNALQVVLGSAIILALYHFVSFRTGNPKAGFVATAILFPLASVSFSLRPQMVGYLFLIFTLIAMERFRQGKSRSMWWLPPVFLVWVNSHGSFIIGLGVIFLYWVAGWKEFRLGEVVARAWGTPRRAQLGFIFLLCLAVLPITPYGARLAVYPLDMAFSQPVNVASILEWQPMPFNLAGGKIFLAVILTFLVLQVTFRFTWRVEELALLLFGIAMACLHVRFVLLFVPFFAPLFAVMLARWVPGYERSKDRFALNGVIITALLAAILFSFPSQAYLKATVAKKYPIAALDYLKQHSIPGPMFNSYGFGGYLVYTGHTVFIDGRGDVYEHGGVLSDYGHIAKVEPNALAVLQLYGVRSCMLLPDEPLTTLLAASPDWQLVFRDESAVVFVKKEMASRPTEGSY